VPRNSIRIVSTNGEIRLVQPATGLDVTEQMSSFTARFLNSVSSIDGFILKFRSPSCGMKDVKVYSSPANSNVISRSAGFFGGAVAKTFPFLAIEDEGRLRNFNIREHFLTKLYALASFREVENEASVSGLIEFHTVNKLLLAAHSQKESNILGNIVASIKSIWQKRSRGLPSIPPNQTCSCTRSDISQRGCPEMRRSIFCVMWRGTRRNGFLLAPYWPCCRAG
jgi:hypothetical protein